MKTTTKLKIIIKNDRLKTRLKHATIKPNS